MRRVVVLAVLFGGLLVVLEGCSSSSCSGGCATSGYADFKLSCTPNDLTRVTVTGPCSAPDPIYGASMGVVEIGSDTPGTCHVELVFATGFVYGNDVSFSQGPPQACGCPGIIGPSTGTTFFVDNPSSTCPADAGADE